MWGTKTEIKLAIKEELKCPTYFIEKCLNDGGRIDEIKNAETEHEAQEIMSVVYEEYAEFCKAWDLDPEEDNTGFKPLGKSFG